METTPTAGQSGAAAMAPGTHHRERSNEPRNVPAVILRPGRKGSGLRWRVVAGLMPWSASWRSIPDGALPRSDPCQECGVLHQSDKFRWCRSSLRKTRSFAVTLSSIPTCASGFRAKREGFSPACGNVVESRRGRRRRGFGARCVPP